MNSLVPKKEFPLLAKDKSLIYLDTAATAQKPAVVIDSLMHYYAQHNANPNRGVYQLAEKATALYDDARSTIASWFAVSPEEVVFTKNATEGLNLLMYSWGMKNVKKGDSIIVSVAEHHANFVPWQILAQKKGARFVVLPLNKKNTLNLDALRKEVSSRTKIVAVNHVSNVLGTTNPLSVISKIVRARAPHALIVADGCQSASHQKINVSRTGVDAFVASPHKFLGPQGIGILIVRKNILQTMDPFLYGGDMIEDVTEKKTTFANPPRRFEAGTQNASAAYATVVALQYLEKVRMRRIDAHCTALGDELILALRKIPGVTVFSTPKDNNGIVSFTIQGVHPHDIAALLDEKHIAVRAGHHCAQPLHRYLGISGSVRASMYVYSSSQDVQQLVNSVRRIKEVFHGRQ
jgi:cysteine desulfurase/selenocysteine lyase